MMPAKLRRSACPVKPPPARVLAWIRKSGGGGRGGERRDGSGGMTDGLDLARFLRPGDRVVWGQGCAEPRALTSLLVEQRHRLGGITCFTGIPAAGVIRLEHTDALAIESYCGT